MNSTEHFVSDAFEQPSSEGLEVREEEQSRYEAEEARLNAQLPDRSMRPYEYQGGIICYDK